MLKRTLTAALAALFLCAFAAFGALAQDAQEPAFTVYTDESGTAYEWFEVQKLLYDENHQVYAVMGRHERFVEDEDDGHGEYAEEELVTYPLAKDFQAEMAGDMYDPIETRTVTVLYEWYIAAYLDGQAPEGRELIFQCDLPPEADEFTEVDFWFVTTRIRLNAQDEIEFMEYVYVPWG